MKRIWRWLGAAETGVILLLFTAFWLTVGSATMRSQPQAFRPLLHIFLEDWFKTHQNTPLLWWWMIPLFITVTFLGLSTGVCTFEGLYNLAKTKWSPTFRYHLGVGAFHLCVILFLLGHLCMEFTGSRDVIALEQGIPYAFAGNKNAPEGNKLSVTLVEAKTIVFTESPHEPPRLEVTLTIQRGSETATVRPSIMIPDSALGWDFHLGMKNTRTTDGKYLVEVRQNPGLLWLVAGCVVLVAGAVLAGPSIYGRLR